MEKRKPYFFSMDVFCSRTGKFSGQSVGVVFAKNAVEAQEIAWKQYGTENALCHLVAEVPEDGYNYFFPVSI